MKSVLTAPVSVAFMAPARPLVLTIPVQFIQALPYVLTVLPLA